MVNQSIIMIFGKDKSSCHHNDSDAVEAVSNDRRISVLGRFISLLSFRQRILLVFLLFMFIFTWFGLGCYGIYSLYHVMSSGTSIGTSMNQNAFSSAESDDSVPSPIVRSEIVIRIVRDNDHHGVYNAASDVASGLSAQNDNANIQSCDQSHETTEDEEFDDVIDALVEAIEGAFHSGE